MSGFVSLVGAGPGDPGLLTVAGRDRLAEADVVLYDRLANPALLDHAPATAELIFAGKSPEHKAYSQEEINGLLIQHGKAGKRVVRLKGGDPFVFGRGGEEALALVAAGVPFEVVPGVTSAIAAPAYAGVPVTHRGLASSFAVVTGHEDDEKPESSVDWSGIATAVDTIVVLMGGAALPGVARSLIAGGRPANTPAVSVEWGTTAQQRSVGAPLDGIAQAVKAAGLGTPLLTVIGQVGTLRDHIAWFEGRPLFGKRVLVTRTRRQASALSGLLRREGAIPVELPTLELVPVATDHDLAAMAKRLRAKDYSWCLFTSANAVDFVLGYLERAGHDARVFASCRIGALGSATADALRRYGLRADLIAAEFTSQGLLDAVRATEHHHGSVYALEGAIPDDGVSGARILIPRAEGGNPTLVKGLRDYGADVDELALYESRPPAEIDPEARRQIRDGKIDIATFASSSSISNLASVLGSDDFARLRDVVIACIGPVTSETAREYGLEVQVEPAEHTIPALVAALKEHFARKSPETAT
ncbi:MAG: uroporphyrinogen-III C-methyltransferase [Dehalococcoidia bacterium]|nr:uroporphyrinogen-III C-methyltransferase [Dehalococcoidia bacterium]